MKLKNLMLLAAVIFSVGLLAQNNTSSIRGVQLELTRGFSQDIEFINTEGELFFKKDAVQMRGFSLSYIFPIHKNWNLKTGINGQMFYFPISSKKIASPYLDKPYELKNDIFECDNHSLSINVLAIRSFPLSKTFNISTEVGGGLSYFLDSSTGGDYGISENNEFTSILSTTDNEDFNEKPVGNIALGLSFNKTFNKRHMVSLGANYKYALSTIKPFHYEFHLNEPNISKGTIRYNPSYFGVSLSYTFMF